MKEAIPEIDLEKCTGCGDCVELCPSGMRLVNGKATVISHKDCDYCTVCETICSSGAIQCPFEIILVTTEPHRENEQQ